jgi:hypothetical protein
MEADMKLAREIAVVTEPGAAPGGPLQSCRPPKVALFTQTSASIEPVTEMIAAKSGNALTPGDIVDLDEVMKAHSPSP